MLLNFNTVLRGCVMLPLRITTPAAASTFRAVFGSSFRSDCGRCGLLKYFPKEINHQSEARILAFGLQRKASHSSSLTGQKLLVRSFLGFSIATGLIYHQTSAIYAIDDNYSDLEEPSGFLRDDLHTYWSLATKFQLPFVLLLTVLLGWRHPIALAIHVVLLLFLTRPNPISIYMFVEQMRQSDMRRDPSLLKTKFLYVKKVEVEDYMLLCMARVELRDSNLVLIGILGGWWVLRASETRRS